MLTAYCKKCDQEVQPGEICPRCGTKLARTAVHAVWTVERRPVTDWMSWNAVMRWLLPSAAAVLTLSLLLEGITGGMAAVERLFTGSFPLILLELLVGAVLLVFLILLLQGKEWMDYTVDSRGVHVARYVQRPTAVKLLTRMRSPGLMAQVDPGEENPVLRLEERNLSWREVSRVQLWPEKGYILFYSPAWWLRLPVRCNPFTWEDVLYFIREKLGKKKAVELPAHLRPPAEKKSSGRRTPRVSDGQNRAINQEAFPAPERASGAPLEGKLPQEMPGEESGEAPDAAPEEAEVFEPAGEQMRMDLGME